MEYLVTKFAASTSEGQSDMFSSIGIDVRLLILQLVAFLILLAILRRWVYPPLVKMLDKREADLLESQKAAEKATRDAKKAQSEISDLLKNAREEANQIILDAKDQANKMVEESDKKAKARAERILESANEDIAKEVANAKKQLQGEMVDLVVAVTEKVTSKEVSQKVDSTLIQDTLKGKK